MYQKDNINELFDICARISRQEIRKFFKGINLFPLKKNIYKELLIAYPDLKKADKDTIFSGIKFGITDAFLDILSDE